MTFGPGGTVNSGPTFGSQDTANSYLKISKYAVTVVSPRRHSTEFCFLFTLLKLKKIRGYRPLGWDTEHRIFFGHLSSKYRENIQRCHFLAKKF